jgi:capsular exopolysaccharide synthesis family protein
MAQYEMGLRDYWRILRKRMLAVVLTCLAAGGVTYALTQHVFRTPPQFQAEAKISVKAAEVVDQRSVFRVNVAQQAEFAKSEMLLDKVVWAVEHFPFYALEPAAVVPDDDRRSETEDERFHILNGLDELGAPDGVASTRQLIQVFGKNQDPLASEDVKKILRLAERQASFVAEIRDEKKTFLDALARDLKAAETEAERLQATDPAAANALRDNARREARDKRLAAQKARIAKLQSFPAADFISEADPELLETVVSNLQAAMENTWDRDTASFTVTLQTTAPGFRPDDEQVGARSALQLTETIAVVYEAYTEWTGRRAILRELRNIDRDIQELRAEREQLRDERRQLEKDLEAATATAEYQEARQAKLAATDQLSRLQRYADQLQQYLDDRAAATQKKSFPPIPPPAGIDDANIQTLYNSSTAIEKEKNDKLEFYKPDSHVIQALEDKIERTARQLREVVNGAVANAKVRLNLAVQRFTEAEAKRQRPLKLRMDIQEKSRDIAYKDRSIDNLTLRHDRLARFQEQGIQVDIIGRPGAAEPLGAAGVVAKTIVGALIGLVLGVVVAVLWESFDLTISTIEEVETFLETRVLGVVPHVEADKLAAEIRARNPEAEAESSDAELQQRALLVTLYDPKSVSAEAFRHIRTALDFARQQHRPDSKTVLVTSATLYEGKTIVAANLAVVLAQNGKRVCLLESDLRRPQLHRVFGVSRRPGLYDICIGRMGWQEAQKSLSDFLLGKISMDVAVGTPGLENLSVITCGAVPPNPVELLDSAETRRLFEELRAAYDVVIVDSPPILPVADAAVISPFVDGAVLVYRAGSAPRTVLSRAKAELQSVDTHLFGVVLNDLRPAAGEISATYPYKGYARKAYALPEEPGPTPRVPAELQAELAVDRARAGSEEQVLRRVELLLLNGNAEQAVTVAYDAVRDLPQSISVRLELARAYAAAGRVGEAQAELIHVLDLDPRNQTALERLAQMALDAGLDREALRWTEEILEFAPDNADARARADEIRARLGRTDTEPL